MHVIINTAALNAEEVGINSDAGNIVRMGFNPSALPKVDRVKALVAALITEMQNVQYEKGQGAREAAIAITQFQGASMFAVAAVTADLD